MASIEGKGFEGLLPPHVVFRQATFDLLDAVLFPEEAEGLVGVGAIRQAEFATCRALSREALVEMGSPNLAIPRGVVGEPIWPAGFIGSITHCPGYRAIAIGRAQAVAQIGIDAELATTLDVHTARLVVQGRVILGLRVADLGF